MKTLLTILIVVSIVAFFAGKPPVGIAGLALATFALFASRPLAEKQGWRRPAMIGQQR